MSKLSRDPKILPFQELSKKLHNKKSTTHTICTIVTNKNFHSPRRIRYNTPEVIFHTTPPKKKKKKKKNKTKKTTTNNNYLNYQEKKEFTLKDPHNSKKHSNKQPLAYVSTYKNPELVRNIEESRST